MHTKTAVLLVNLGTPDSARPRDVYRYLIEFLTDRRVIDTSWLSRQLLVRGVIVPFRFRQSAKAYQQIWTKEGSPLKVYGKKVESLLQNQLGENYAVALAMRYQNPSIKDALTKLMRHKPHHLIVLPLFPQYASATTGSVNQKVMEEISQWEMIPKITMINQFATHPHLINAFCQAAAPFDLKTYDHILFSFHGLPQRQIQKIDNCNHCFKAVNCCDSLNKNNRDCYSAQCYATGHAIAKELCLDKDHYSISFQSRLGKEPWLEPFTADVIPRLAKNGKNRVLVFCPAFVCDCLETIYEIGIEYAAEFKHAGGKNLHLVPGLNDSAPWINALEKIVVEHSGS